MDYKKKIKECIDVFRIDNKWFPNTKSFKAKEKYSFLIKT